MRLQRINRMLARAVLTIGIAFVIGSVVLLAMTGEERLLVTTVFGTVAAGYAAAHLARLDSRPADVAEAEAPLLTPAA